MARILQRPTIHHLLLLLLLEEEHQHRYLNVQNVLHRSRWSCLQPRLQWAGSLLSLHRLAHRKSFHLPHNLSSCQFLSWLNNFNLASNCQFLNYSSGLCPTVGGLPRQYPLLQPRCNPVREVHPWTVCILTRKRHTQYVVCCHNPHN